MGLRPRGRDPPLKRLLPLLLLGALLAPLVQAAPQVLPASSATVFVNGAVDYFQFAPSSMVGIGSTWEITNPSGEVATATQTEAMPTGPVRFTLDGTIVAGSGWTWSGNLNGVPADGTWQITGSGAYSSFDAGAASSAPGPTLAIAGKTIHWGFAGNAPLTYNQYWNWHITTTTWNEPSTVPTANIATSIDLIAEAPDEDPNNARFFTGSTFTAYTLNYGTPSSCATSAVVTVNGAWIGATGTTFSQFLYRDGDFTGTADLRSVFGFGSTTEENEGSTGSGTDAKSIPYNNVAGTSYQFKVRDTTGEALGVVIFIPGGLCAATIPPITGLLHDENEFQISVSHAQCSNDAVSFELTLWAVGSGSGAGAITVTAYDAQTGTPRVTFPKSIMHVEGVFPSQVYSFSEVFSPGAYVAIATVDITGGLGVNDYFDAESFNVPRGQCQDFATNLEPVLLAIESSRQNVTDYLDTIHDHLHGIDANINVTRGQILDAIENLNVTIIGNVTGNFTLDNATLTNIYNELLEHRANTIEVTMTNDFYGLGFDGLIFLFFWIAALLFFSYQGWLFALGFSIPGLLEVLFPTQIPEDFTVWFVFCLLGVILEVAARRFQWGPYKKNRNVN